MKNGLYKYIAVLMLLVAAGALLAVCGKSSETTEETVVVTDGEVKSPEDFTRLGVYIDIADNENVTDKKYSVSGDIAIVSFRYTGVRVEFRASCKYERYELAGVEDTGNGDMIVSNVNGWNATFFTLDPGRAAFWSDENINYSLYIYVTSTDDVLNEILSLVEFEDRYSQREDVKQQTDSDSRAFAERLAEVIADKNLTELADMVDYPQETGSGQSLANRNELLALDKDELCTDILVKSLTDENAMDELRLSDDGSEYIIGTNYKNIHFKLMDDGTFKIVKINN